MEKTINFLKTQWVNLITLFIVIMAVIYGVFFGTVIIDGASMEPSYSSGDLVIVRTDNSDISNGDTVTVSGKLLSERNGQEYNDMIKRVVATPGQKVSIIDDKLYVDDNLVEEDYIREDMEGNMNIEVELSEDEFFVMGDNRNFSLDSRAYGPVTRDMIGGHTFFTLRSAK